MKAGFILLYVVMAVSIISGIVVNQVLSVQREIYRTVRELDRLRWNHAARSGVELMRSFLESDTSEVDGPGDAWYELREFAVDEIQVRVRVEDEQGKLNINRLIYASGEPNDRLMAIFHRWCGKECPDELQWSQFFDQWVERYRSSLWSAGMARLAGNIDREDLERSLTVFGNGYLNINTCPEELLPYLVERDGDRFARQVCAERTRQPFTSPSELKQRIALNEDDFRRMFPVLCITSSDYRILVDVLGGDAGMCVEAVVHRDRDKTQVVRYREWWL